MFQSEILRAKIVYDVALEGSARKLVTVRSALIINNQLPDMVELKMENMLGSSSGKKNCLIVQKLSF